MALVLCVNLLLKEVCIRRFMVLLFFRWFLFFYVFFIFKQLGITFIIAVLTVVVARTFLNILALIFLIAGHLLVSSGPKDGVCNFSLCLKAVGRHDANLAGWVVGVRLALLIAWHAWASSVDGILSLGLVVRRALCRRA